ncbi:MAG: septum formation initiator family protein [Alistipes sp.]|nr:septum formation initiator family protein [Alistipes sp.]
MQFGKKVSKQVEKGISKGKKYAWRVIFILAILLGIYLIGRPALSLIEIGKEISALEAEKAGYEEFIKRENKIIEALDNNDVLEQYARENYFMQGEKEQVFIVE